tara:strand:+ start:380 stop:583 length:204 start_codon:yes stop_codon:yes gene_type:complete
MRNSKLIGNALKEARKKQGMSREQLAVYTGFSERTIQNIELGINMSSKSLNLLMEALKIKACQFYVA